VKPYLKESGSGKRKTSTLSRINNPVRNDLLSFRVRGHRLAAQAEQLGSAQTSVKAWCAGRACNGSLSLHETPRREAALSSLPYPPSWDVNYPTMNLRARISSNETSPCPFCTEGLDGIDDFVKSAGHLQQAHGLSCLHVGQETTTDNEGRPYHTTVAIFGLK
jgi:hypothetical protein